MKRFTTPASTRTLAAQTSLVIAAVIMAVATPLQIGTMTVHADQYDDRINAIQREIDEYQSKASRLQSQADTLSKEVAALSYAKEIIQGQIDLKQAERDKLAVQIADSEAKISNNRDALGDTIANIYLDDQVSPLEMLAGSQNIGQYVDKQEYRGVIREQLTKTIDQIKKLKRQLEKQKKSVERVIAEQEFARNELANKEAERQNLLARTRGQEAAYQQLSAAREQQKLQVQQEQQRAIEAAMRRAGTGTVNVLPGDPNKGGYPWEANCYVDANAVSHGGDGGDGTDPLGYGCRQCVSYTAYRVGAYLGGRQSDFPRYWGNANMWPGSARKAGFQTGSTPRVNSVGVISAGQYGHVVWVEAVNSDGTVDISQYNYYNAGGPGWGHYSKMRVSAATYDTYIYF